MTTMNPMLKPPAMRHQLAKTDATWVVTHIMLYQAVKMAVDDNTRVIVDTAMVGLASLRLCH